MPLIKRILESLETTKSMDQRKLAQAANVYESALSRYLNGFEELNFESVLRIVKILFPKQEKEIMIEYIYTQKSRNARYALEYCTVLHYWEVADYLINILFASNNPVDKEWATVYEIMRIKIQNKLDNFEILERIETFKPNRLETKILKNLLKAYIYHDLKKYNSDLNLNVAGINGLISELKPGFIKESFRVRLGIVLSHISLFSNDISTCREQCSNILNQSYYDIPKGLAYYHLGHSYIFEDYNKSNNYLTNALEIFTKQNHLSRVKETKLTLSFMSSYWKKSTEFTLDFDDQRAYSNYIYYLIQKDELSLGRVYLEKIKLEDLSDYSIAFYYYYRGLINNDLPSFYKSIERFFYIHDYFHVQLPIKQLKDAAAWY